VKTRRGQFLIAASTLKDPNFHRTVVLIVRDDENGTFGLILNRPLETTVKDACASAMSIDCEIELPLHLGGPCEGLLTVVHSEEELGEIEVLQGVFFTSEREKIERLLSDNPMPARYFAGYAGWSAGQLDAELETGSWLLTPGDQRLLFATSDDLWNRIITQVTIGKWVDVDRMPEDPSMN
jgi:putative transcriptional regulator